MGRGPVLTLHTARPGPAAGARDGEGPGAYPPYSPTWTGSGGGGHVMGRARCLPSIQPDLDRQRGHVMGRGPVLTLHTARPAAAAEARDGEGPGAYPPYSPTWTGSGGGRDGGGAWQGRSGIMVSIRRMVSGDMMEAWGAEERGTDLMLSDIRRYCCPVQYSAKCRAAEGEGCRNSSHSYNRSHACKASIASKIIHG